MGFTPLAPVKYFKIPFAQFSILLRLGLTFARLIVTFEPSTGFSVTFGNRTDVEGLFTAFVL